MNLFTALLSALALAASTTTATPVEPRAEPIIITPQILSPVANDTWLVGTHQTVRWNTSQIPPGAEYYKGKIYLGYMLKNGSENLFPEPLAEDFLLISGGQNITVPRVFPRNTYIVVLDREYSDRSGEFTILEPFKQ